MAPTKYFAYDSIGNILTKSDVGQYSYEPPPGSPRQPHAVMSISGDTLSTTFEYDANGNQTSGLGRTTEWTSSNKPLEIRSGTQIISFQDDVNHQRFKQVTPQGTTLYFDAFGTRTELVLGATSSRWNDYLSVGNQLIGMRSVETPRTALARSRRASARELANSVV